MSKVLILGGNGQLGKCFEERLSAQTNLDYQLVDKNEVDITDIEALRQLFDEVKPEFCINCAAYTQVDKAELEEDIAFEINSKAVFEIGECCKKHSCILIHFSTDYVYDNGVDRPLLESDNTKPQTVYGKSKREGERSLDVLDFPYFIFRISWLYSAYGNNFVKTMYQLTQEKEKLEVVFDQIGCITYAPDLAADILSLIHFLGKDIDKAAQYQGIYNYTQNGIGSWYDVAYKIAQHLNAQVDIQPVTSEAFPRPASRPHYSVLNTEKIRKNFPFIKLRHWEDCLKECLNLLSLS